MEKRETLVDANAEWTQGHGAEADIVLCCRGALLRNLADFPFPDRCTDYEKDAVVERVTRSLRGQELFAEAAFMPCDDDDPVTVQRLSERGLANPTVLDAEGPRGVLVNEARSASVTLNGRDHVSIQAIGPGLELKGTWTCLDEIDTALSRDVEFAFHERYGFLTSSIDVLGTGLSLLAMLHLPALSMAGGIMDAAVELEKQHHVLDGALGPVTEGRGDLYCLSNKRSLGQPEEEIVFHLRHAALDLVQREREARRQLMAEAAPSLEDRVWRAVGVARNARLLDFQEALGLLSSIRLGASLELLDPDAFDLQLLNSLFLAVSPAHIAARIEGATDSVEASVERARLFRAQLT
jgi:protein arginine kinase